jgi:hypothetical protein
VASTDEAVAVLQKTDIPVDVVLSKIDIPGSMNGFGFAQWARSARPGLKIVLAGTPERMVQNAAEQCEVGPTLKRPYDHKRVLRRIKRLLAARGAWSGCPIIAGVLVVLIVLGVVIYGVSKTVIDTANTTTSAPHTTGQGSPGPTGAPSGTAR